MLRYIFITGGVVSSLGKGVTAASVGALLQGYGYKVRLKKLDPYINVDPGTMSPYQHGEVFVTDDGVETDLDFGYYERFTGMPATKYDTITSGKIYEKLIAKERRGDYLGGTVMVIPHVTQLIKEFIVDNQGEEDFVICEIGGTVGDIEALPYLESLRQLQYEFGSERVMCIHLTLLPFIKTAGELKTKPTQHSVKELRSLGVQPDIVVCRADREITADILKKVATSCSIRENSVIAAPDLDNIYYAPVCYHENGLDASILKHFKITTQQAVDLKKWHWLKDRILSHKYQISIAIVGKYNQLPDAYKSLIEAISHAGWHHECKITLQWVDAENTTATDLISIIKNVDGIIVPGGFGTRGIEGKLAAIQYARINEKPIFGICLGMQLMAIEFAQNILKIKDANSTEFSDQCTNIIDLMMNWTNQSRSETRNRDSDIGGTMRLGSYKGIVTPGTMLAKIYNTQLIEERHRHRFEFNINYRKIFEEAGMMVGAQSADDILVETLELNSHPWFIGVQFHPEYKSKPFEPHPLFMSFVATLIERGRNGDHEKKAGGDFLS